MALGANGLKTFLKIHVLKQVVGRGYTHKLPELDPDPDADLVEKIPT
jgi:hypothetical protein